MRPAGRKGHDRSPREREVREPDGSLAALDTRSLPRDRWRGRLRLGRERSAQREPDDEVGAREYAGEQKPPLERRQHEHRRPRGRWLSLHRGPRGRRPRDRPLAAGCRQTRAEGFRAWSTDVWAWWWQGWEARVGPVRGPPEAPGVAPGRGAPSRPLSKPRPLSRTVLAAAMAGGSRGACLPSPLRPASRTPSRPRSSTLLAHSSNPASSRASFRSGDLVVVLLAVDSTNPPPPRPCDGCDTRVSPEGWHA